MTVRTVLQMGSHAPTFPYPFGLIEELGRVLVPPRGTVKATVTLPNTNARLIRAKGVGPADGTGRVVLYLHGGAFIVGGPNTHSAMVSTISQHADAPCLVVNYRMPPKASLDQAIDDCLGRIPLAARAGVRGRTDCAGRRLGRGFPVRRGGRTSVGRRR